MTPTTKATERTRVALYALDVERVAAFYAGVAGLTRTEVDDGYVALLSPSLELVVVRMRPEHADGVVVSDPPARREDTPIKLGFLVPSIAAGRATAPDLGGGIDDAENEWDWLGRRHCDGHDPEGNVIQLQELLT